jgi:hypothetical protein
MNYIKIILFIDAIGALVTAMGSGIILKYLYIYFNLPEFWLIYSIVIAAIIAIFDIVSITRWERKLCECLKITICANGIFVIMAIIILTLNFYGIRLLGRIYISSEILIVTGLIIWQLRLIHQYNKNQNINKSAQQGDRPEPVSGHIQ